MLKLVLLIASLSIVYAQVAEYQLCGGKIENLFTFYSSIKNIIKSR